MCILKWLQVFLWLIYETQTFIGCIPMERIHALKLLSPSEKSQHASGHYDPEETGVMVMSGEVGGARSESSFNYPYGCRHRLVQVLKTETKQTKPDLALWVKEWLILGDLILVHKMVCRSENLHGRGKKTLDSLRESNL